MGQMLKPTRHVRHPLADGYHLGINGTDVARHTPNIALHAAHRLAHVLHPGRNGGHPFHVSIDGFDRIGHDINILRHGAKAFIHLDHIADYAPHIPAQLGYQDKDEDHADSEDKQHGADDAQGDLGNLLAALVDGFHLLFKLAHGLMQKL